MKEQTVCLIIPPSPFLLDERVMMSLGILKVAAAIEGNFPLQVLDLSGISNYEDVVENFASQNDARIFCLTATTPQMPAVKNIIAGIRQQQPQARVILGGPHVTLCHTSMRRERHDGRIGRGHRNIIQLENLADVLVAGDGEKAIWIALSPDPPKLIDADDPHSPLFLTAKDLASLPWPARHLLDVESYRYTIDGVRALSMISQLDCPYGCSFCGGRFSPSFRRMRSRQPESIVAEMKHLFQTYGHTGFMFYDDELNVNPELTNGLLREIIRLSDQLGVEFRLRGFIKAQLFTEEQAALMYQAGFRWLLSGFESGSPEMLTAMNKRSTLEENERCISIARDHGLKIKALMSLGHPGESPTTAAATKDWLFKTQPDDFDLTVITVYPGTAYYDEAEILPGQSDVYVYSKNGIKLYSRDLDFLSVADFYKGDPNGGYESFVFTDLLSSDDIVRWRNEIDLELRSVLGLPFPTGAAAQKLEHSMGQRLPDHILRSSPA